MIGSFAQLTYTSFGAGPGRLRGWQVKESTNLAEAEAVRLIHRVNTDFDAATPIGSFPNRAELASLPRRLVYDPTEGLLTLAHTVPAGPDATGRPGNVFVHFMVSPIDGPFSRLRPIRLWRSPDWLAPFGSEAVAQANLPVMQDPRPGPVVGRTQVMAFLRDPKSWQRTTILACLVDALRAGRQTIVAARSLDSAALWVGAASEFTSAARSLHLGFAVCESAQSAVKALTAGARLVAVACPAGTNFPGDPDIVRLDEDFPATVGELDATPHRTATGVDIPVTEWWTLVNHVLEAGPASDGILKAMDDLDRPMNTGIDIDLAVPLSAAISQCRPDGFTEHTIDLARHVAFPPSQSSSLAYRTASVFLQSTAAMPLAELRQLATSTEFVSTLTNLFLTNPDTTGDLLKVGHQVRSLTSSPDLRLEKVKRWASLRVLAADTACLRPTILDDWESFWQACQDARAAIHGDLAPCLETAEQAAWIVGLFSQGHASVPPSANSHIIPQGDDAERLIDVLCGLDEDILRAAYYISKSSDIRLQMRDPIAQVCSRRVQPEREPVLLFLEVWGRVQARRSRSPLTRQFKRWATNPSEISTTWVNEHIQIKAKTPRPDNEVPRLDGDVAWGFGEDNHGAAT
jgi:hypothetical protein